MQFLEDKTRKDEAPLDEFALAKIENTPVDHGTGIQDQNSVLLVLPVEFHVRNDEIEFVASTDGKDDPEVA